MKGLEEHPDVGDMGTSGRLLPKPDCRVKNKTLSFAGPGNVKKKKDEKKCKSIQAQNWDQFRTKLTRGADRALGTTGKQTNACRENPRAPCSSHTGAAGPSSMSLLPSPSNWLPNPGRSCGGCGGAVIPLGPAAVSLHQLCSLSLTSSTVCCPPLDTASTRRFSSCFPVISTGLQTSSSSPVPSW